MIFYAVGGLIFGLFGAPLVFYLGGMIVIKVKRNIVQQEIKRLTADHNKDVGRMRSEYEGLRKRFHKKNIRIQKVISRAKAVRS